MHTVFMNLLCMASDTKCKKQLIRGPIVLLQEAHHIQETWFLIVCGNITDGDKKFII